MCFKIDDDWLFYVECFFFLDEFVMLEILIKSIVRKKMRLFFRNKVIFSECWVEIKLVLSKKRNEFVFVLIMFFNDLV